MHTEVLGHYRIELSARQIIDHGGWAAFAAIYEVPVGDVASSQVSAAATIFPIQRVVDETVFESEEAAIAGARRVAIAFLRSGNTHAQPHVAVSPAAPVDCARASGAARRLTTVPTRPQPSGTGRTTMKP